MGKKNKNVTVIPNNSTVFLGPKEEWRKRTKGSERHECNAALKTNTGRLEVKNLTWCEEKNLLYVPKGKIDSFNIDDTLKRASSRIIWSKVNKNKSSPLGSIDINDLTSIKGSETDLSIMLKQGSDENISFSKMKKMKSIKKINIVLCIILFVISLVLIILLFLYK